MDREPNARCLGRHWLLGLTAVLLLAFKLAVVDRIETPFRHSKLREDGALPGIEHPLNQPYADELRLIGFDRFATPVPADQVLRIDLHWTVRQQPSRRYQTVIHLVGLEGLRWSASDSYRPTDYEDASPTNTWTPGRHALDSHEIEPLPGTPPGVYDVVLTVFERETLAPLSVLSEQGQPAAPELTLGQVTLVAPQSRSRPEDLDIQEYLDVSFGALTLLGADFDRESAAPGDPVYLTTFWRLDERSTDELALRLELLAPDGSVAGAYDLPPTAPWHPVFTWRLGDIWRGQHLLHLPAALDSGKYHWRLSVLPMERSTDLPIAIRISAPERTFTPVSAHTEIDVQFGGVATLSGASFEPELSAVEAGETFTATLVWRAESETDTSYRAFLHLLAPDGRLVDQSDGVPAGWTRPTTGWLPGEYVEDVHVLTIPADGKPGDYTVYVGLYGPDEKRLATRDGSDAIRIARIMMDRDS